MKKISRLEISVNSAVKSTINRFKDLSPTDRFVLLEELGEWVFCEYEEIDFEWLNYKQCGGSSINNSKRNRFYSKLRNGNLEGVSFPGNYIFIEEKKEVLVLYESSITAMEIGALMKRSFPQCKLCLCNRETFIRMGGKL